MRSVVAVLSIVWAMSCAPAQAADTGILTLGDVVVTGFSGTVSPDPTTLPPDTDIFDETLIDPDGISARVLDVASPGFVWDGKATAGNVRRKVLASEVGQVFGVALDDAEMPNIYLAASSVYGLPIVLPDADNDGRPERLKKGEAGARFMDGLFGPAGGPGSIWKVDGVTGEVSLFADVTIDGAENPGPGLGNLAYDPVHRQLFVSDRATGMIHRFNLEGAELEIYDHGTTGRTATGLPPVAYDPAGALDISRADFDTEDPDSWGYAAPDRRVWGLAVHDARLYYAVVDDSQIWSVGIDDVTGAFTDDSRWELDVPKSPKKLPVSDILFTEKGAMILAQRGPVTSTYDYVGFADPGNSRLYRYWLESPDDPATPSRWIEAPEEYAVGFGGDNRQTDGGVDLNYGFNQQGVLDFGTCEASLFTTGDDLRLAPELAAELLFGGPLALDGLQVMPAGPVKPENTPPWASYIVDIDPLADDAKVNGHVGDVAVYRKGCGGDLPYLNAYGGAGYPSDPPYISGDPEDPPPSCDIGKCPGPKFTVKKTCEAATINPETGKPRSKCRIDVTSNGAPFAGLLSVNEVVAFGSNTPFNQTILSVGSADAWTCDQPPFAATDPAICTINWHGLSAVGNSSVIDVEIELPDPGFLVETENCATLLLDGDELDQSCTDIVGKEPIDLALKKGFVEGWPDSELDPPFEGAVKFTVVIQNIGAPFNATAAVSVTDLVPVGMTISAVTGANWICTPVPITGPGPLTCQYTGTGVMATGDTSQLVLWAWTSGTGPFENCAKVGIDPSSGLEDSDPNNNSDCATVGKKSIDLQVEKRLEHYDYIEVGDSYFPGLYTVVITNNGPSSFTALEAVSVTDYVPAGMTLTPVSNADWTCTPTIITGPGPLTCLYIGTGMATGAISQVTFGAKFTGPGPLKNCAVVGVGANSGLEDTDSTNNQDCVTVGEDPIDLALEKSFVKDPVVQGAGEFTVVITNIGAPFNATAAVSVTDLVPAGMTISAVTGADWICTPVPITGLATLTCQFTGTGVMATGATSQLVLSATTTGTGPFENCANVGIDPSSGLVDSNPDNNSDCASVDGFDQPDDPPPVGASCGTNVIFVVDESRSIADANATHYVTNALTNAASIFNSNGSQAAVIRFSDTATVSYPMATATYGSVNTGYAPAAGGGTNWEAAMIAAHGLLTTLPPGILANTMIVFITDGTPTAFLDAGGVVTYTVNSVLATNEAIPAVNAIYALGVPIVGVGIGSVSTHLNALLGISTTGTNFNGLNGTLTALAQGLCPDIYLQKQIGPSYINFNGLTADPQVTVTLSVTNTTSVALTNVTVQDALPAELNTPVGFSLPLQVTVTGTVVDWTIPSLAAGATATLTFQVTVSPNPAPTANWRCLSNFAQVTASDVTLNSVPNNMANPVSGPVAEHDEASGNICVQDKVYVPYDCGTSRLNVTKKAAFPEVCVPGGSPDCTFNITVTALCKDFSGPVLFGDGLSNGSGAVNAPIASISNNASPAICPWSAGWSGTTAPSWCSANITLPVNQSIIFTVTLASPLAVGSGYKNCFVADGKTPQPADFNAAMAGINPTTWPGGGTWGNCAPFSVAAPALVIPAPPPANDACKAGTVLKRGACVPDLQCKAPAKANSKGTFCICPNQTIAGPTGCAPIKPDPISCNLPAVANKAGTACICPRGTVAEGKSCVKVGNPEPETLQCNPPAVANKAGTACVCPKGTVAAGKSCVRVKMPTRELPTRELPTIELPTRELPAKDVAPKP